MTNSHQQSNRGVLDIFKGASIAALLAAMLNTAQPVVQAQIAPQPAPLLGGACYATYDDGATVYNSSDSSAVRTAIALASPGDVIKLAGYCAGTASGQLATLTQTLTLRGGYQDPDWTNSYPLTRPTTLDAQGTGRVLVISSGNVTLDSLIIRGGSSVSGTNGGGIYASGGNLTVTNSLFRDNIANGSAVGGGIGAWGGLTVLNSTFLTNTALVGGAINAEGYLSQTIQNSTFAYNVATLRGGAIASGGSNLSLINNTLSANHALSYTGGVYFYFNEAGVMYNNIFYGNTGVIAPNINDFFGETYGGPDVGAGNLAGATSGLPGVVATTNPLLGPLEYTGLGGTGVFPLLDGSGAFNTGNDAYAPATDQRGVARPQHGQSDIGAYERVIPSCYTDYNNDGVTDFISGDAQAVRDAVNVAASGSLIKIAGYCPGVQAGGSTTQTVLLTKTLTLQGGYTLTNWAVSNPISYPTTLDAQSAGRVLVVSSGNVTLDSLIIRGGSSISGTHGGGIYTSGGNLTVTNSILRDNVANGNGVGGGLAAFGGLNVWNSTFLSNTANTGGGLQVESFLTPTVQNSTFAYNTATLRGGAIASGGSNLSLINNTISANHAMSYTGGVYFYFNEAGVMYNNIFYGNTGVIAPNINDFFGETYGGPDAGAGNLTGAGTTSGLPGIVTTTNPMLGPMEYTGLGGTGLFPLPAGSPALNMASATNAPTTDQRGVARPQGMGTDIGAYEKTDTTCYATLNGTTVYSGNAQAVRDAIAAATAGQTVKVAGYCAGVQSGQVISAAQNITLRGGYSPSNWNTSYPLTQPTTLDALGAGRVALIITGNVTLDSFTIRGGSTVSGTHGGGIYASGGNLTVTNSTLRNNIANGDAVGGAIASWGGLTVLNSTFLTNTALVGGAINAEGYLSQTVTNSTFAYNVATFRGGAIASGGSNLSLINNTISANHALSYTGGVYFYFNEAGVMYNNIFYGNTAVSVPNINDFWGETYAGPDIGAGNLAGAAFNLPGVVTTSNPLLGPMQYTGLGGTGVFPVLDGSAAINLADTAHAPATDQRGTARPQNGAADIGAYEKLIGYCFTDYNNDGITDFVSGDAQAVRDAVNVAVSGSLIKIAGYCAGVQAQGGTTQTVLLTKTLTLQGGYTITNWAVSNPLSYLTTLDAQGAGRVAVVVTGNVTLDSLVIRGGSTVSGTHGGGIYASGGNLTVTNSLIRDNIANGNGVGGGLAAFGGLSVWNSTFLSNTARTGGGLQVESFLTPTVQNSTFAYNVATLRGGAITSNGSNLSLINNTISANHALSYTGGVYFYFNDAGVMYNNIFYGNTAVSAPSINDFWGETYAGPDVGAGNLAGAAFNLPGVITTANPLLGPMQYTGLGGTGVFPLLAGSPALNTASTANAPTTDQRGVARPQGLGTDIGAYEKTDTTCYATLDGTTVYSGNAQAVRDAVNAATSGSLIKVAGYCPGVQVQNSTLQTVLFTKTLTLRGGYTITNWAVSNPLSYPTTLDAQSAGRVAVVITGNVTLDSLTIRGGSTVSGTHGSGIYASGGYLTVTNSLLRDNIANGNGVGGGLAAFGGLSVWNSTFLSNTARTGGGLQVESFLTPTVQNSTFAYNVATLRGGAITSNGSNLSLINNTISANHALSYTGGVYFYFNDAGVMYNNIFYGNTGVSAPNINDFWGETYAGPDVGASNLAGAAFNLPGVITTANPLLGPMQYTGLGGTGVFPLPIGSSALDIGDTAHGPTADQRGIARPQNLATDIGAYEAVIDPNIYATLTAAPSGPYVTYTLVITSLVLQNNLNVTASLPISSVLLGSNGTFYAGGDYGTGYVSRTLPSLRYNQPVTLTWGIKGPLGPIEVQGHAQTTGPAPTPRHLTYWLYRITAMFIVSSAPLGGP